MELKNFQKTLLESLNKNRFSLIKHSRQMGISTVLKELIIETLLKENNITIVLFADKLSSCKDLLNKIRLDNRIINLKKTKDTVSTLILENGNMLKIASTLDGLRGYKYTYIIIDNACFINHLEKIIANTIPILSSIKNSKLIVASSNKKGNSYFNELFKGDNNFIKNKIHWSIDEENLKKYDEFRLIVDSETFKIEMDLEEIPVTNLNKDHLLSFRLNNNLYMSLSKKLLDLDLSLSEYLRNLIKKDTNE